MLPQNSAVDCVRPSGFLHTLCAASSEDIRHNHSFFTWVFARFSIGVLLSSESALLNQARLDRRDPRLGLTQRLGACMHGVGTQDKVVIMRHSRAKDELCIGSG